MAIFNYAAREMTAKVVYYGPGLSGKTTSIQCVHAKLNPKSKGKLVSLATETDRTLFFDFFPVEFGQIGGFRVKFNFYTVPGQVFYNTTRKLVLKGADGVVFVADSQPGMMEQNLESLDNLKENLRAHGLDPETVPFVIQFNKRDLPGVLPVAEMRRKLNFRGVPDFETSANTGQGIMDAMKAVCRLVLEDIQAKQKRSMGRPDAPTPEAPPSRPAPEAPPARPVAEPKPAARPAEAPAPRPAEAVGGPAGERTLVIPLRGPGTSEVNLAVPLELRVEEGVEAVQVTVQVKVAYWPRGQGGVTVREVTASTVAPPPPKKGFFARLFGRG